MNQPQKPTPPVDPSASLPTLPEDHKSIPLIRYAATPGGLLAARDEVALRRHIFSATDAADQNKKLIDLLLASAATLSVCPSGLDANSQPANAPAVMQLGLIAWPVVVCMQQSLQISNRPNLEGSHQAELMDAITCAFKQALTPNTHYLRIERILNLQSVMGLSPLAIQSEVLRESKMLTRLISNTDTPDVKPSHSFAGRPLDTTKSPIGPHLPVAFLLVAYVGWDHTTPLPTLMPGPNAQVARLQSLWDAYFTHALPPTPTAHAQAMQQVRPTVRLGEPLVLHDAATQAQWMQMAWMAEHARKNSYCFRLRNEPQGPIQTWTASVVDDEGDVRAEIQYSYDGFWQPASHIELIHQRVSLAQGTGRMASRPLIAPLGH